MSGELAEFFAMGGHGLYVWLSYGISLIVILGLVLQQRTARKTFHRQANARRVRNNEPKDEPIDEQERVGSHASET